MVTKNEKIGLGLFALVIIAFISIILISSIVSHNHVDEEKQQVQQILDQITIASDKYVAGTISEEEYKYHVSVAISSLALLHYRVEQGEIVESIPNSQLTAWGNTFTKDKGNTDKIRKDVEVINATLNVNT